MRVSWSWRGSLSVGEVETGEDRAPLFAESIVNSTDDVRSDNASKAKTGCHAVIFETDIFKTVKDLSGIEEGRKFKISRDTSNLGSGNMDTFFDTRRDQVFVDESIDPVAPKLVLPPQRTLFKKWNLITEGDLQIGPYHEDRALGFAWKELLHI